MINVKLCGLTRPCDIAWANAVQADYAGFVFAGKKRRVSDDTAAVLRRQLDSRIPAVGVFVDEAMEHIVSLVAAGTIQLVQLHGHEDEAYIKALRQVVAVPLIQAFAVAAPADIDKAQQSQADYILLDNGPGGTGTVFDWNLLQQVNRPYFLAGGLTPENVAAAVRFHPFALDVSSGIESNGVKDKYKIETFMAQVRSACAQEGIE